MTHQFRLVRCQGEATIATVRDVSRQSSTQKPNNPCERGLGAKERTPQLEAYGASIYRNIFKLTAFPRSTLLLEKTAKPTAYKGKYNGNFIAECFAPQFSCRVDKTEGYTPTSATTITTTLFSETVASGFGRY